MRFSHPIAVAPKTRRMSDRLNSSGLPQYDPKGRGHREEICANAMNYCAPPDRGGEVKEPNTIRVHRLATLSDLAFRVFGIFCSGALWKSQSFAISARVKLHIRPVVLRLQSEIRVGDLC
jgi:hypothetical protein